MFWDQKFKVKGSNSHSAYNIFQMIINFLWAFFPWNVSQTPMVFENPILRSEVKVIKLKKIFCLCITLLSVLYLKISFSICKENLYHKFVIPHDLPNRPINFLKIYGLNTVIAKMVSKWKHILFRLLKLTSWFAKGQRPRSLDHHLYSETTSGISILQMIILYLEVFQWNHRSCFLNLRPIIFQC